MKPLFAVVTLLLAFAGSSVARADDVAAERARLANQRILAEQERRARQEAEQIEQGQPEQAQVEQAQPERAPVDQGRVELVQVENATTASDAKASPPVDRIEMSRALEQLRELGSLRDAGYLTDEEFQLLKMKILDGAL